jgi:hypothetical protein
MSQDQEVRRVMIAQIDAANRGALGVWTIYDKPTDHPDGYIARMHEAGGGNPNPIATHNVLTGELEAIRDTFVLAGLTPIGRQPDDPPKIVESWL